MEIKILDCAGLEYAFKYVGLPVDHQHKKEINALKTLSNLVKAGDEHAKIMRQVVVWMEITAPRYWWTQFVTYRIGCEVYSSSTMHTLLDHTLTSDDFEGDIPIGVLASLNITIDKGNLIDAKQLLPDSFLQKRVVMVSYQTLRRMYFQRRHHKLPEWHQLIGVIKELPFSEELIFCEN